MLKLFKNPSSIITVDTKHKNVKRGKEMNDVSPLESHSIVVDNDTIKDFIPNASINETNF
ncbi:MAG: hypothetical protein GXO87_14000, partial [Chlorobi bacterium]|nr:hypothetical protein [Chlorobiota bacterium]